MASKVSDLYICCILVAALAAAPIDTKATTMGTDTAASEPSKDEDFKRFSEKCYSSFEDIAGKEAIITDRVDRVLGPANYEVVISYKVKVAGEERPLGPFSYKCVKEPGRDMVVHFGR
jgi:hypothetical protein